MRRHETGDPPSSGVLARELLDICFAPVAIRDPGRMSRTVCQAPSVGPEARHHSRLHAPISRLHVEGRPAARTFIPHEVSDRRRIVTEDQSRLLFENGVIGHRRRRSSHRYLRSTAKHGAHDRRPSWTGERGCFLGVLMRFSLSSLARFAIGTILVSSAAAIGLARLAPQTEGWRMLSPSRYANVNTFYFDQGHRGSSWLDREGGPMREVPFRDEELLEYASCSPWRDEQGRSQVVGRWSWSLRSETPDRAYGLARITFPDGEVLDHVETDVVPVSNPCWYPGTGSRILFAAGDGKLYQCNFESRDDAAVASNSRVMLPRPILWNCKFPDGEGVFLAEPHWPSDPGFSRLLFVSLRSCRGISGKPASSPAQIWWLLLSEAGGSVEEAGRMIAPPTSGDEVNERCPALGRVAGRSLPLGLLSESRDAPGGSLSPGRRARPRDTMPPGPPAEPERRLPTTASRTRNSSRAMADVSPSFRRTAEERESPGESGREVGAETVMVTPPR